MEIPGESPRELAPHEGPVIGSFHTTRWTEILCAARPNDTGEGTAFGKLFTDYWAPLYCYVRRRGHSPHDAEDVTQAFFMRLIEKQALGGLRREGGRFRSFLLRAMENFLANEWDRARALKRGGSYQFISKDSEEAEGRLALSAPDNVTPALLFERQWVLTLLDNVLDRLRLECVASGKSELFGDLKPHLQGEKASASYAEIGVRRGMSEGAIKVAVHRLRLRYGELLRDEIARTVNDPEEVEAELRHLMTVASG